MAIRYVRFALPNQGAGTQSGPQNVATFDDNAQRTVVGALMTNQAKQVHVRLDIAGRVYADLDGGIMAQQRDWIPLDQPYPAGTLISVNTVNDSAGGVGAVDAIIIKYTTAGPNIPSIGTPQ